MSKFLSKRHDNINVYVPGEQPKDKDYIRLNTNESPYPPSPKVIERINAAEINNLKVYSDHSALVLRKKLADLHGLKSENIVITNGSDEALNFFFLAFCDETTPLVFPDITYGFYKVFADFYHIPYEQIPLNEDFSINVDDYCGINKNIIIANPNAPSGLLLPLEDIERIVATNPNNVVLIDEAYTDFCGQSAYKLTEKYDNLLVVQTFSKSRFLAGARLGFAIGSREIIHSLDIIRNCTNPYNVNHMTLLAGEASIDDNEYYMEKCREIMKTREYTTKKLREMGAVLNDSNGNFVFVKLPGVDAAKAYDTLKENAILVRYFNTPRTKDYLRVTIGTKEQMDKFLAIIADIMKV